MINKKLQPLLSCMQGLYHYILGLLSRILFWFFFNLLFFIVVVTNNFLQIVCTETGFWTAFYDISSSFLIGGLISFLFYFLVIHIPERKKRRIIKVNLKQQYANVKEAILHEIISASRKGGRTDLVIGGKYTIKRLLTTDGFIEVFEGGREGHEGFYAFRNYMSKGDVPEYREIIINLKVLSKQIDYVLHNYPIKDEKIFDFFKWLEGFLIRLENRSTGYYQDEEGLLSSFIWPVFSGYSTINGYMGYDFIEKMIEEI